MVGKLPGKVIRLFRVFITRKYYVT